MPYVVYYWVSEASLMRVCQPFHHRRDFTLGYSKNHLVVLIRAEHTISSSVADLNQRLHSAPFELSTPGLKEE